MSLDRSRQFATIGMPGKIRLYLNYGDPNMYTEITIALAIKYRDDMSEAIRDASSLAYQEMVKNGEIKE